MLLAHGTGLLPNETQRPCWTLLGVGGLAGVQFLDPVACVFLNGESRWVLTAEVYCSSIKPPPVAAQRPRARAQCGREASTRHAGGDPHPQPLHAPRTARPMRGRTPGRRVRGSHRARAATAPREYGACDAKGPQMYGQCTAGPQ